MSITEQDDAARLAAGLVQPPLDCPHKEHTVGIVCVGCIAQALRDRDRVAREEALEQAAQICEATLRFSPKHELYSPADGSPCGWCDGLEDAAAAIRTLMDGGKE